MSLMLPDGLEWVLEMLGFDWPKADEDKLHECAQVWRDFADQVDELNHRALSAANSVRSANSGDSIDAFGKAFDAFSTGGDGYLADAARAARLIATAFDAAAVITVAGKLAVIAQLVVLATEIIAAQAAAPFTFGLSEVGALGATQATRMIVRRLLKELREALVEAILETLKDPVVSAVQAMISDLIAQTVDQGFGAQSGYDLGRTVKTGWDEGKSSVGNWKQTFGESLRDGLGSRAGGAARHHADRAAGHGDGGHEGGGHEGGGEGKGDGGGREDGTGESGRGDSGGGRSRQGDDGADAGSRGTSDSSGLPGGPGPSGGSGPSTGGGHPTSADGSGGDASSGSRGDDAGPAPAPTGDHRGSAPLDPFGTRLASDPAPAPAASAHAGTDGRSADGGSATGPQHREPSAGDAGAAGPVHTGTDGRPAPAADAPAGHGGSDPRTGDGPARPEEPAARPQHGADHDQGRPAADGGRPAPSLGPVRGADGSGAPVHTADHGGPSYGPVRGDAPAPAADRTHYGADTDRPGTDVPPQRHGSRPHAEQSVPQPEHSGAGTPLHAGAVPHGPTGDAARPGSSDGPHRATVRTASTVVADAPPIHNPGPSAPDPAGAQPAGPSVPNAPGVPGVPGHGMPPTGSTPGSGTARPPLTDRPTAGTASGGRPTVPGQGTPRPDRADHPVRLGAQPAGGRPDPRDARTGGPSRPDRRTAAQPRRAEGPADRPAAVRPSPAPAHRLPEPGRPDHRTAPDHRTVPDHHTAPDHAPGHRPVDPDRPATADRPHGPGGLVEPTHRDRERVESTVPRDADGRPRRHPDPEGDWPRAINGDDPDAPGRRNNCVDVALATVDTYSGHPTPAAARTPDHDADGRPSDRGERGGRDRIENALGARFSDLGDGPAAYHRLEDTLRREGHGSQAVIITRDADGRAHAWNAVNHRGRITYVDAQTGRRSGQPLHSGDHGVFAVPLGPDRRPVTPNPDHHAADGHADRRAPDEAAGTRRTVDEAGRKLIEKHVDSANNDEGWFRRHYDRDGHRRKGVKTDDDGNPLTKLMENPDTASGQKWIAASDKPSSLPEDYKGAKIVGKRPLQRDENTDWIDAFAEDRERAKAKDIPMHDPLKEAKKKAKDEDTEEAKAAYEKLKDQHREPHAAMTKASERYGDQVAEHWAVPENFEGAVRIDDRVEANNRFDQIWRRPDGGFVVVEAKAPSAELGDRKAITGRYVMQGHPDYFRTILEEMRQRGERDDAPVDADGRTESDLADDLEAAWTGGKLDYVLVRAKAEGAEYDGYELKHFKI